MVVQRRERRTRSQVRLAHIEKEKEDSRGQYSSEKHGILAQGDAETIVAGQSDWNKGQSKEARANGGASVGTPTPLKEHWQR